MEAVVPFDILVDRRKRSNYITDMGNNSEKLSLKAKVVQDAAVALASMEVCEEALERELLISTSYVMFPIFYLNSSCHALSNLSDEVVYKFINGVLY